MRPLLSRNYWQNPWIFLIFLGVPVIRENAESDWVLAQLNKNHLVDYVLSEDSDLLTFGAKSVMKNFSIREQTCNLYNLSDILSNANITQQQFIDMCILCGCDYSPRINMNMNCSTSFQLIKQHTTIENVQSLPDFSHINLTSTQNAREIFLKQMEKEKLNSFNLTKKTIPI